MKIIPVIDILNGKVVHAVRGDRSNYLPIQSVLGGSVDPVNVARTFQMLGFNELYVADLDAIIDCSNSSLKILRSIADESGLELMVDAGVTAIARAQELLQTGVSKIVVGTETLKKKSFVGEAVSLLGTDRVIISLDLEGERVLVKEGFDGCKDAMCLLKEFEEMGVSEVIILDLSRVGSEEGINLEFMKKTIETVSMNVYVGGGVKDIGDLITLESLDASGVLIASALHSGKISIDELKETGFL